MGIVKIRTFLINSIFLKLKIELRDAQRYRTLVLRRWFPRTWMCVSLHSLRRSSHLTGSSRNHLCATRVSTYAFHHAFRCAALARESDVVRPVNQLQLPDSRQPALPVSSAVISNP